MLSGASWADNPFHDFFGLFQDPPHPGFGPQISQSHDLQRPCSVPSGQRGSAGVTQPRNVLTSSLCAPACTAGTRLGPPPADVFLVPAQVACANSHPNFSPASCSEGCSPRTQRAGRKPLIPLHIHRSTQAIDQFYTALQPQKLVLLSSSLLPDALTATCLLNLPSNAVWLTHQCPPGPLPVPPLPPGSLAPHF